MIKCTECDAEIKIPNDAMENEIVTCPDCGASYELIKSNNGFAIRPAQSVGEDWGELKEITKKLLFSFFMTN
jgi:alpha-aminoadipate carrier protein LysW